MTWWVYKCNSRKRDYQNAWGDWGDFFFDRDANAHWGTTEWVPALAQLRRGDMIIAYQTDRNELVGLARVRQSCERDTYLYLTPVETIEVKVRPLKDSDPRVAAIPAFQPGPIRTIYPITDSDARRLLETAGATFAVEDNGDLSTDGGPADEETFLEGEKRAAAATARNPKLRAAAKKRWGLKCYCCGFDFGHFYGGVAQGLAIVHHLQPFAITNRRRRRATVEEVRVVCANCHYVVHVKNPPIDVDNLKARISKSWTPWTNKGVERKK